MRNETFYGDGLILKKKIKKEISKLEIKTEFNSELCWIINYINKLEIEIYEMKIIIIKKFTPPEVDCSYRVYFIQSKWYI